MPCLWDNQPEASVPPVPDAMFHEWGYADAFLCMRRHLNFAKSLILQNQDAPFDAVYALWLAGDISGREGARRCGIPPSTFYRKAKLRRAAEAAMAA